MSADREFVRVLHGRHALALSVGAMVGWGWVVMSGEWILRGGSAGAALAFAAAGAAILLIALLYAELASAMPEVGGEHVYSHRALGPIGSFFCTWSIIFVYVGICCFEAVGLATVVDYVDIDLKRVPLWNIAGYQVYLTWALIGVFGSVAVTFVNVLGVKQSAVFQVVFTLIILAAGVLLFTGAMLHGSLENLDPLFPESRAGILSVMMLAPFFFVGFDVIPQAAEEIKLPFKNIGWLIVFSVLLVIVWYCLVTLAVSALLDNEMLASSNLPTADANKVAWGELGASILILGGISGIITSWNAFVVGGSRAIYAMAKSGMLPRVFGALHNKYRTPYVAVILIGVLSAAAPFLRRPVLVWIVNASSFGAVIAYFLVTVSFLALRYREPNLDRPFKLVGGKLIGCLALIVCVLLGGVYLPGSPSALGFQEWTAFILWWGVGGVLVAAAWIARGEHGDGRA